MFRASNLFSIYCMRKLDVAVSHKNSNKHSKFWLWFFQEFDYFTTVEDERVTNMQDMDKLAELLSVAR